MLDDDVRGTTKQVNDLTTEIAGLNKQIQKIQALGDNPNDLKDRRDLLVGKLSTLVDITVTYNDPAGEMVIDTGGMHLVQGAHHEQIALQPDKADEGYSQLVWDDTRGPVDLRGGKLASLVQLRDGDARSEIQSLDHMTVNFIDLVNEIHRKGFGLNGETGTDFFVERPFVFDVAGNYDRAGKGAFDSTWLFRVTGANALKPKDLIGLQGTITLPGRQGNVTVDYHPTDTVEDLITRINLSGSEVVARLNSDGKLSLKAVPSADPQNPDFVLRGLQDSGQFLVGYAGSCASPGRRGHTRGTRPTPCRRCGPTRSTPWRRLPTPRGGSGQRQAGAGPGIDRRGFRNGGHLQRDRGRDKRAGHRPASDHPRHGGGHLHVRQLLRRPGGRHRPQGRRGHPEHGHDEARHEGAEGHAGLAVRSEPGRGADEDDHLPERLRGHRTVRDRPSTRCCRSSSTGWRYKGTLNETDQLSAADATTPAITRACASTT